MKLVIGRNLEVLKYIEPFLLPDDDYDKGTFLEMIRRLLLESPEMIYIPVIFDGEDVKAFLVSIAPPDQGHVWIVQAWASPSLDDKRVKDQVFLKLIIWTLGLGRTSIRGETQRKTGAFLRSWGFEPLSQILSYEIDKDFEEKILLRTKQVEPSEKLDTSTDNPSNKAGEVEEKEDVKDEPIVKA